MTRQKNTARVSGSLLSSNESRILQPVECAVGVLQVRVIGELDTHGLFLRNSVGESLIATHGNGYSCRALLEHIVAGETSDALRQAQYILDCGGTVRNLAHIQALIEGAA